MQKANIQVLGVLQRHLTPGKSVCVCMSYNWVLCEKSSSSSKKGRGMLLQRTSEMQIIWMASRYFLKNYLYGGQGLMQLF